MSGKIRAIHGFLIMLLFIIYFLIGSIRMILVGLGKQNDPIRNIKQKSKWNLVRGIIGLVIFLLSFIAVSGILIFAMICE